MSDTQGLNAGDNPIADAMAKRHVELLMKTGMAYEFSPETIATRAFLDGFAAICGVLDAVKAERDRFWGELNQHRISSAPNHLRGVTEMVAPAKHTDTERLAYVAAHFANAIHYCCRVDGDEWNTDFFGTLDRTMQRDAAQKEGRHV